MVSTRTGPGTVRTCGAACLVEQRVERVDALPLPRRRTPLLILGNERLLVWAGLDGTRLLISEACGRADLVADEPAYGSRLHVYIGERHRLVHIGGSHLVVRRQRLRARA
jgi:hypothetical protein